MGRPPPSSRDFSPHRISSDLYYYSLHIPPSHSHKHQTPCILLVLSSLLHRVVIRNERRSPFPTLLNLSHNKWAVFSCDRPPTINIEQQYLDRIFKYADCSPSCFVVAYAYTDRIIQSHSQFLMTSLNVHRLLITSVMVAAKFLDDIYYDNAYYAKIGGLTTQEMNRLEMGLLSLLDFRLQVTVSVFESYCSHLEREVALGGGYQIERALLSICALDGGSAHEKSGEKHRVKSVTCSEAS